MLHLFNYIPFLPITIAFMVGIIAGAWSPIALLLLIAKPIRKYWIYIVVVIVGGFTLVMNNNQTRLKTQQKVEEIAVINDKLSTYYRASIISCSPYTQVLINCNELDLNKGDTISASFYFEEIAKYTVDDKSTLYSHSLQGVMYIAEIYKTDKVYISRRDDKLNMIYRARASLSNRIEKLSIDNQSKAVIRALIIGDKSQIDKSISRLYRRSGVMHFLAVSGFHIATIFIIFNLLLSFMNFSRVTRVLKSIIIIAALTFYALICGMVPSVVRAVIMFSLFQATSHILTSRYHSFNVLLICALMMIAVKPTIIWNVSFQLSFTAMGTLLIFGSLATHVFKNKHILIKRIAPVLLISTGISLFTLPISLYYFGRGLMFAQMANIAIGIILPFLYVVVLIALFWTTPLFEQIIEWIFRLINSLLELFSSNSLLYLNGLNVDLWDLTFIYIAMFILFYLVYDFFSNDRKLFTKRTQSP